MFLRTYSFKLPVLWGGSGVLRIVCIYQDNQYKRLKVIILHEPKKDLKMVLSWEQIYKLHDE
ncbi:MAG: hypothetical protein IPH58_13925 [Sphingobacteriales bacterium]|nr:hypothetical protein [Sphingobacteriales bacterium]